ncbi:hypothetical protein SCH4B_0153 [Ruegeria sp. TrichCH4B]|nr:hypothetical protein SCH4B_0153 [Ruegeria sp. TrichCH4B]
MLAGCRFGPKPMLYRLRSALLVRLGQQRTGSSSNILLVM